MLIEFAIREHQISLVARHGYKTPTKAGAEQNATAPQLAIDPLSIVDLGLVA